MNQSRFELAYDRAALKSLQRIHKGDRKSAERIRRRIESLREEPRPAGSRQLTGREAGELPIRRLRCGDYRALYVIREDLGQIQVLDIAHRRDVYREF